MLTMKRLVDYHLKQWKENPLKNPLLLRGARQVGKTYAAITLGKTFENIVEINFEFTKEAKKFFKKIWTLKELSKNSPFFQNIKLYREKLYFF